MSDQSAVPVVVVSKRRDDAEAISQALRNGGKAAHCTWVADADSLPSATLAASAELLFVFAEASLDAVEACVRYRDSKGRELPVLAVSSNVDERSICQAILAGAQDLVSLGQVKRFQMVAARELEAGRQARELQAARISAQEYQRRVESMLSESSKALIYSGEGIVLSINPACLELLGYADESDLAGTTVMDLFEPNSQTALKGALVACAKGKWTGHALRCKALCSDGSPITVQAHLESDTLESEPCVRIELLAAAAREKQLGERLAETTSNDPLTAFYHRRNFHETLAARLKEDMKGGLRALYHLRPDRFVSLMERLGPIRCDGLMLDVGRILADLVKPGDLFGQLAGGSFVVLAARGNERDVKAWADHLRAKIAQHRFELESSKLKLTCSIGVAVFDPKKHELASLMAAATKASAAASEAGGDRVQFIATERKRRKADDTRAVASIKTALMKDGFRLVYQPIANLQDQSCQMFDVLVRMVDAANREILPSQFLPAAERNGLMKSIDRWVLANAVKACAEQPSTQLFVRLSGHSIPDPTLVSWLGKLIEKHGVGTTQLVVQITELDADEHLESATKQVALLKELGCMSAIEHFGVGRSPLEIVAQFPVDFVKIDGSLMQGLAGNAELQKEVRRLVAGAKKRRITTIAERVEDANTMAVLWQLGVEYIQGYYVQGPEEIVLESA